MLNQISIKNTFFKRSSTHSVCVYAAHTFGVDLYSDWRSRH